MQDMKDTAKSADKLAMEHKQLLKLNERLATVNAESANLMAELEESNETLQKLNSRLALANAHSVELMVELEEKNDVLKRTNLDLAKANAYAAELMAINELKDEEIMKLNKALAQVNTRGANLIAEREMQMEEIHLLNHDLNKEIDERKNIEERLVKTNATKDRFFSIIAHDLRNPFNSIVNLITLIDEHAEILSKDDIMEMVHELHSSADKTKLLLEGLLQWQMVQSDGMVVKAVDTSLMSVIDATIPVLQQHALTKNIKIVSKVDATVHAFIDENMIATVIRNLVSNAIKFTPNQGCITLSSSSDNGKVYVHVSDNGIGMRESDLANLFRIDKKVSQDGTAKEKGSGLGLILCKEFVEKNNGKLSAVSELGEGSTFTFSVPQFSPKNKLD